MAGQGVVVGIQNLWTKLLESIGMNAERGEVLTTAGSLPAKTEIY